MHLHEEEPRFVSYTGGHYFTSTYGTNTNMAPIVVTPLPTFVGRDDELALLTEALYDALAEAHYSIAPDHPDPSCEVCDLLEDAERKLKA